MGRPAKGDRAGLPRARWTGRPVAGTVQLLLLLLLLLLLPPPLRCSSPESAAGDWGPLFTRAKVTCAEGVAAALLLLPAFAKGTCAPPAVGECALLSFCSRKEKRKRLFRLCSK